MKNTAIINLFGAAGVGKTTQALKVAGKLKDLGYSTEYVHEYAKIKTWNKDYSTLLMQTYMFEKQKYYQDLPVGKVDFVVMDSPILLSDFYGMIEKNPRCTPEWRKYVFTEFNKQNNYNFLIMRNDKFEYEPEGRNQTLEQSNEQQNIMIDWLNKNDILFTSFISKKNTAKKITRILMDKLW